MYPDSWIYRGFTSCNFDLWWKQNGGAWQRSPQNTWLQVDIYAQTALIWKFYNAVCTATSTFDKWHDIRCLRAEFTAKHRKAPLSLTTRWWMEPDLGSWQSPDISRSHLYRGTIAWTSPTAIYRAYTVHVISPVDLRSIHWFLKLTTRKMVTLHIVVPLCGETTVTSGLVITGGQ